MDILNTKTATFIPNMFINIEEETEEPPKYTDERIDEWIRNCITKSWLVNKDGNIEISPCAYDDHISEETLVEQLGKWYNSDRTYSFEDWMYDYFYDYLIETIWEREQELYDKIVFEAGRVDDPDLHDAITAKLEQYEDWHDVLFEHGYWGIEYDPADFLPPDIRLNLILATPAELNHNFGSISDTFCDPDNSNCTPDMWDNALTWLIEQQGHSIDKVLDVIHADYEIPANNMFIASVCDEIYNAYSGDCNALTILCSTSGKQFFDLVQDLVTENSEAVYKVDKSAECGLYAWSNGSGSCLEIDLETDVNIPAKMIYHWQVEARKPFMTNYGYSVDDVYGLCGSCWSASITKTC